MVNISLFDNLEFKKDGKPILEGLLNTRKTKQFLSYLILNKDRAVTQKELFELLWSGQEYSNPGTALRTLLYRYRTLVSEKNITELEDSVFSKRNAYQWNNELDVSIDIFDFEAYSAIGNSDTADEDKREECLKAAIELYKGTLLKDSASDHWVVKKAVFYRDMYVSDVCKYADILRSREEYSEIEKVVTHAITVVGEIDILSATLKLAKSGKDSEGLEDEYNEVITQTFEMETEVDKLQKNMEADDGMTTAFVCDLETFKDVYRMQRRLLARTGETMYLSLMTLGYPGGGRTDELKHEKLMSLFIDVAKRSLRCGDSLCRYSYNKMAIMFPAGSYDDARKIVERVRRVYTSKLTGEKMVITFRVRPLKNINDER